jgi:hypothetical protein
VQGALRIVQAILLFYVACVGYRILTQVLFVLAVGTGALIAALRHGGRDPAIMVVANWMAIARDSMGAMLLCALGVVVFAAWATRKRQTTGTRPLVAVTLALVAMSAVAVAADLRYHITPLDDVQAFQAPTATTGPPPRVMTVDDVRFLRDAQVGTMAEMTGELRYDPVMHRFRLVDAVDRNASVYVFFHRGGRSLFDESFVPGRPPRYYDQAAPLVGQHVRVRGAISRSQIDVDVRDVAPLPAPARVAD